MIIMIVPFCFKASGLSSKIVWKKSNWCLIQKQVGSLMAHVHTVHLQVYLQVVVQWQFSKKKMPHAFEWGGWDAALCLILPLRLHP